MCRNFNHGGAWLVAAQPVYGSHMNSHAAHRQKPLAALVVFVSCTGILVAEIVAPVKVHVRSSIIDVWILPSLAFAALIALFRLGFAFRSLATRAATVILSALLVLPFLLASTRHAAYVALMVQLDDLERDGKHYRLYVCHCPNLVDDYLVLRRERAVGVVNISEDIWTLDWGPETARLRLSTSGKVEVAEKGEILYSFTDGT